MAKHSSDILILGAGVFGTSTAYHLSTSKASKPSVTVVDRTPFPPEHAASTDINKIVRQDYTSRFYMDLATEAMHAWETWPQLAGKGYFHRTGWVAFGEKGSDLISRIRQNFRQRGRDPTADLTLEQVKRQFGGIFQYTDFSDFDEAYWNPEAAWCDAGMATGELMQAAVDQGVKYICGDVERLILDDEKGISAVKLKDGTTLTADKIVLATGAWTSSLLTGTEDQLNIPVAQRVEAQVKAACVSVVHYPMHFTELEMLKEMPVVVFGDHGDAQPPPRNKLLKMTLDGSMTNTVTTSTGHKISVPPEQDQRIVSDKLKQETIRQVSSKLMPQFTSREPAYWRLCWDAVTPSQDHLICQHPHPRLSNLYLAVGGSFHSYKFLPTIGKYVVNVLQGTSNGREKDEHWAWKTGSAGGRGAHEKAYPHRELRDFDDNPTARL